MLHKIFKDSNKRYCFTINNTFHILYFLSILKEYDFKNTVFIITNTYNFFIRGGYDTIFEKNGWNYIIIEGEDFFRKFPYSILDIYSYKREVKKKLQHIEGYHLIVSQDSLISNNIILKFLSSNNNIFHSLIDTTVYSLITDSKKSIQYYLFKLYLSVLGIKRGIKSGEYFAYNYMIFAKDLDTKILHKHLDFLKSIFLEKLESLKAITTKKNVIFLSQNIIDEYKISPSLFRNKLFEIRNEFTHRGYTFFIKPHPLENTSYYKGQFDIIDKTIPSELLDIYFGDKETIYITFFSTVILNLQFGKKYLIGDIGFGENERSIIDLLYEKYKIPFLLIK